MTGNFDDWENDPEERRRAREEFLDIAQEKEIAEGDISVSETRSGKDPLPDLDNREVINEILGEDALSVLDEDDPALALSDDDLDDLENPDER